MVVYLLQLAAWTAFIAALILWPAGTLAYPGAWAFIGLFTIGGLAMILWLSKHSPSLLRERMASPVQRAQEPWDRIWLSLFVLLFCGWMAFMGWDAARTGFTAVPPWVQVLGGLAIRGIERNSYARLNAQFQPVYQHWLGYNPMQFSGGLLSGFAASYPLKDDHEFITTHSSQCVFFTQPS